MVREMKDWNVIRRKERRKLVDLYARNANIIRSPSTLLVTQKHVVSKRLQAYLRLTNAAPRRYHVLRNMFLGTKTQLDSFRSVPHRQSDSRFYMCSDHVPQPRVILDTTHLLYDQQVHEAEWVHGHTHQCKRTKSGHSCARPEREKGRGRASLRVSLRCLQDNCGQ